MHLVLWVRIIQGNWTSQGMCYFATIVAGYRGSFGGCYSCMFYAIFQERYFLYYIILIILSLSYCMFYHCYKNVCNLFIYSLQEIYNIYIVMQSVSSDQSRSPSKKKKKDKKNKDKDKDKQKDKERDKQKDKERDKQRDKDKSNIKQKRDVSQSLGKSDKYSYNTQVSQRKKKNKDKHKSKKNRSRSRERSRDKKKNKDRAKSKSKSLSKQKQKQKQKEKQKEKEKAKPKEVVSEKMIDETQNKSSPKREMTQAERARKFAMRQVRARLLKFNEIKQDDDGDDSDDYRRPHIKSSERIDSKSSIPPPLPSQGSGSSAPASKFDRKRQSKWGKNSSNEPNIIMVSHQQPSIKANTAADNASKGNNLQIDHHDDHLKISEDKSIDVEEHPAHEQSNTAEEIDPLDEYMNQIQAEAVPQMDLPKKGEKGKVITFEDIVTQVHRPIKANEMIDEKKQQEQEEEFRKKFLQAVNNMDEVKASQDKKGTMMENNEERQSDFSDYKQQEQPQLDFFAKQRKMAQRKQLSAVDHSKIQYEDVQFNLYREADEIKNMDPKLVMKYRKEAGDIKVRGKGILNPTFNWYHCGFSDNVLSIIEKSGFEKPFPIQAQAMPMIISGRDVIGIAETGSGKTCAYLFPMIKHVSSQRPCEEGEGPIGVIMTPTRQLANQVYMEAKKFCKSSRIRVVAVYGGLQIQKQLSQLKKGAQIIICTPGRMIDILTLNKGRISNLKRVTMLVIDQADRMFDLGFEPQITRIVDNVRPNRQTVMFSATFPKNVQNLARRILTNPVQILVGSRGQACRNVQQIVQVRQQVTKFLRLLQILGHWNQKGSILIFIDKQTQADFLYQQLLKYGYDSLVLHGAMDPTDRQFTIYDFKKGIKKIMIATSVCARGLDIKQIVLVVNFKCPNHLQDYIHRIGRTGRAGNKGTAITFITPQQQQYSIDLIKALQMSQIHAPEDLIKLSQEYLKKVKKGQARKIRNRNIQGAGFKFDKQEQEQNSQIKDMLKKQLKSEGLGGFQDSDDDDIETKKKKQEELRGRNTQQRVVEAIKNPEIKNKLLNEAVKAVSEAISKGSAMTTQKLLQIAVSSMKQSITKHKVITTVDDGVEQVTKLINSFQNKGDGQGMDYFSYDFQINDYPNAARNRACSQQFLNQVQRQNNCTISLRGVCVQPGKKAPVGCRKLYLHIQSQDKSYVSTAYKDIKRVIEEGAYENMHMGGGMGKYSI